MSVLKNIFSNFLICSPAIIISYAYYIEIINGLLFYISFILSLTLIIYFFSNQKKKITHSKLFDFIAGKKLNEFINYIKNNNLSISELNKITYYGNITLIIYAIENESDNIIDYLLENGYDLNFYLKNGDPPIIYCAYRGYSKYLEKLLSYKKYFDINVISKKFNANALEIAVWKGKKKNY
jgi:ankyrin repeat protein